MYKSCTLLLVIDLKNVMILPENVITTTEHNTQTNQVQGEFNLLQQKRKEYCMYTHNYDSVHKPSFICDLGSPVNE